MNSTYNIAKRVIMLHVKTKAYLLNMLDVYFAVGRLTSGEYAELVALVNSEYPED